MPENTISAPVVKAQKYGKHVASLLSFTHNNKLPVILQSEAAECGLACLAMVAGFYGYKTDLTRLRQTFSVSAQGVNLKQIMDIASKLNLATRALKLEIEDLKQLQQPCLLHWEMKHFVVLKCVKNNTVTIHDPASGERSYSFEEVSQRFTGVALELSPSPEFEQKQDAQTLTLGHFWSRISGLKRSLVLVFGLSVLLQFFAIMAPFYMQTVVDDVLLRSNTNLLLILAIGFTLLMLIETGTSYLRQYVILNLSSKLNIQMAANVFHHLIRLPMDYFIKRHMGDVVSRFASLNTIRELLTTGLVAVVLDGLMAIITLFVMLFYDVMLSVIVIIVVLLYALLRYALYRPIRMLTEESLIASAKENSHFMESVRAIQTIKLFEKESDRQNAWQNSLALAMNKNIQISRWNIGFDTANRLLFGAENIIIIYFAATAVMGNLISLGMMYAFISYKTRFIASMDNLITKWIEFRMLDLHFSRLADIVFTEADQLTRQYARSAPATANRRILSGKLQAKDLSFAYSDIDKPVFNGINFTIEAGEIVAIIGPSGVGKSTLLKCLMGLVAPRSGELHVDDQALSTISDYRSQIAGVLQDDQLLSGSITDNITCFDDNTDMEKVYACAQLASIHEDIVRMPMQYNTLVGDMGTSLSGGQKQRIVLARAIYRRPRILFMDEATSHLDTNNEAIINQHIKRLNITQVIVAHRPETIRAAQKVFKLDESGLKDVTREYAG